MWNCTLSVSWLWNKALSALQEGNLLGHSMKWTTFYCTDISSVASATPKVSSSFFHPIVSSSRNTYHTWLASQFNYTSILVATYYVSHKWVNVPTLRDKAAECWLSKHLFTKPNCQHSSAYATGSPAEWLSTENVTFHRAKTLQKLLDLCYLLHHCGLCSS